MKKQILVAVDGSVYSFNVLRYLSYLFTDLDDITVHLLYVVKPGTISPNREWMDDLELMTSMSPQTRGRLQKGRRFMEEAVMQLGRRGIAPEQVTTSVCLARSQVANDIIAEARRGLYDAVVIGRRGISKVEEVFMGSVSSHIVEKCFDLPIWVVDGKVNSRKFLVPVDGTYNSLKAADHLGFILEGNPHAEITLFHMASIFGDESKKTNHAVLEKMWGKEWCDAHIHREDSVYHAPEQMLIEKGVDPKRISRFKKFTGVSASRSIVRHSVADNYGTIVIGRRGKNYRKGMFKGVSNRVLGAANHVAIWVVG